MQFRGPSLRLVDTLEIGFHPIILRLVNSNKFDCLGLIEWLFSYFVLQYP